MNIEQQRAAFEAWYVTQTTRDRDWWGWEEEHGQYGLQHSRLSWAAWQAGRAAPQSQEREDAKFLQEDDQHDLHRFIATTEDGQGYDIGKDRIKRLAELGVVSNQGFGRYSVTMFGYWCHERYWHQNPTLPLKTIDEHNAQAAIDHARRIEGGGE